MLLSWIFKCILKIKYLLSWFFFFGTTFENIKLSFNMFYCIKRKIISSVNLNSNILIVCRYMYIVVLSFGFQTDFKNCLWNKIPNLYFLSNKFRKIDVLIWWNINQMLNVGLWGFLVYSIFGLPREVNKGNILICFSLLFGCA